MSTTVGRRLYAFASAIVAVVGLLVFDWSPTGVLLLYWLETVVLALAPLLVAIVMIAVRREGLGVGAVLLFLAIVLGGLLAGQALVISVLGLFERAYVTGLGSTTLAVPVYEPLVATLQDRTFLASAAVVVAFALGDLWPRLVLAQDAAPKPTADQWTRGTFNRLFVTQVAVVAGGALIVLTKLPSAAALLLVGLKLWLDLRTVAPRASVTPATPQTPTPPPAC